MHLLLQLLDLCSVEKKRGDETFAFGGGVPRVRFLYNHGLFVNGGVGWSIADQSRRISSIFYRQKRFISIMTEP